MRELVATPVKIDVPETLGEHMELPEIVNIWGTISDESGVPLDSDLTKLAEGIDFKYKSCPFRESPSRYGKSIVSGLEQERLSSTHCDTISYLLSVRRKYMEITGFSEDRPLVIVDGQNILGLMQFLPVYLVKRAKDPVDIEGSLPKHLVVGSNSASGSYGALGCYSERSSSLILPDGDVALQKVEEKGSLVGERTACAASPAMIVKFLDLLKNGSSDYEEHDISEATDGLLPESEFGNALIFGQRSEALRSPQSDISHYDERYTEIIKRIAEIPNSQPLMGPILAGFKSLFRPLMIESLVINDDLNRCLGRQLLSGTFEEAADKAWQTNSRNLSSLAAYGQGA
jgi:hypothetical protein